MTDERAPPKWWKPEDRSGKRQDWKAYALMWKGEGTGDGTRK